jgi:hypothetical protein
MNFKDIEIGSSRMITSAPQTKSMPKDRKPLMSKKSSEIIALVHKSFYLSVTTG